jgi:hypothetical protein
MDISLEEPFTPGSLEVSRQAGERIFGVECGCCFRPNRRAKQKQTEVYRVHSAAPWTIIKCQTE